MLCEVTIFKSSFHKTKFEMVIQDFGSAKTNSKCCYLITKIPDEAKARKSTYRSKVNLLHLKLSITVVIRPAVKQTWHKVKSFQNNLSHSWLTTANLVWWPSLVQIFSCLLFWKMQPFFGMAAMPFLCNGTLLFQGNLPTVF